MDSLPQDIGMHQTGIQLNSYTNILRRQVPRPSYRHAAPAGPWPYVDNLDEDQESEEVIDANLPAIIGSCGHDNCSVCSNWIAYPQSHFGNWTIKPVTKCGIERAVRGQEHSCTIYRVDVLENGVFRHDPGIVVTSKNKRKFWNEVLQQQREHGVRVRALFVDKMSGPVLQMLGATYNIEPFFFSSSLNWIPSRYQENAIPKQGDHITITLTFVRTTYLVESASSTTRPSLMSPLTNQFQEIEHIDTQAPLLLHSSNRILLLDLLAIHMVRDVKDSTIISYHHAIDGSTTAMDLFTRLKLVGRSVYWQILMNKTKDPTFILLVILWSAFYAWDEALEQLYDHFCWLESRVIVTNNLAMTYELHVIRAHLLHYISLLSDFKKSVIFIRDTHNPSLDADTITDDERKINKTLLSEECEFLLTEIERLMMNRRMQDDRVQNVTHLVYAMVNIEDSRAMKQLSYMTMIFLPASFMAGVFGMNVMELNSGTYGTIPHYVAATLSLTVLVIWIIVAYQSRFVLHDNEPMWKKLLWPFVLLNKLISPRRLGRSSTLPI